MTLVSNKSKVLGPQPKLRTTFLHTPKRKVGTKLPWLILVARHWKKYGEFPNILGPETFTEKVLHRILFDRRRILVTMADKLAVRPYIALRLGPAVLPQLYCVSSDPASIPFDRLPKSFVIKANHGSGWIEIVRDKSTLDRDWLVKTCVSWLTQNWYDKTQEWAYRYIRPRILVEELIQGSGDSLPNDYKFFVFNGQVELIEVDTGRFSDHRQQFFNSKWEKLPVRRQRPEIFGEIPPPPHLSEMIAAAEVLGTGWDFIRVDFYDTDRRFYVGELTTTPARALHSFSPKEFDRYLGARWKLPERRASQTILAMTVAAGIRGYELLVRMRKNLLWLSASALLPMADTFATLDLVF